MPHSLDLTAAAGLPDAIAAVGAVGAFTSAVRRSGGSRVPEFLRRRPQLVAHRGGAALAPENTLAAFREAVADWGADMLELDVRVTADDHAVVIHDPTVDRTTDGTGAVAAFTLDALRRLDAGYRFTRDGRTHPYRNHGVRVPTVAEVLDALPATPIIAELKTAAAQEPLFDAVRRAGAERRVVVASLRDEFRTRLDRYPGPHAVSRRGIRRFYVLHRVRLARLWGPSAPLASLPEVWEGRRIITPRFVRDLQAHGVTVQVWTVNERADMERLLDWGVDGILTDRPDRLAALLTERFGRAPAPRHRRGETSPME